MLSILRSINSNILDFTLGHNSSLIFDLLLLDAGVQINTHIQFSMYACECLEIWLVGTRIQDLSFSLSVPFLLVSLHNYPPESIYTQESLIHLVLLKPGHKDGNIYVKHILNGNGRDRKLPKSSDQREREGERISRTLTTLNKNIDAHLCLKTFIKKYVSRLDITVYDLRMTCIYH